MSLHVNDSGSVTDIVLMPNPYPDATSQSRPIVHFTTVLPIFRGVSIGPVDDTLAQAVMDACDPAGEQFRPIRQFSAAYALQRPLVPVPSMRELRPEAGPMYVCVALSRLVHPTTLGYAYAARIRSWPDGQRQIVPYSNNHLTRYAFVIDPHDDWLLPTDVPEIRTLVEAYYTRTPSSRIHAALWYYEYVSRSYYTDVRWPLLVTGLESLIHIDGEVHPSNKRKYAGSTKVFVDRLLALGAMDRSLLTPEQDLRDIYRLRSGFVHGQPFGGQGPNTQRLYRILQSLLAGILRKALIDQGFAAIFASDASVSTSLPLR
jgi:hypothetical protein